MTLADQHRRTENHLRDTGSAFVILRNRWYLENYADQLPMMVFLDKGRVVQVGEHASLVQASGPYALLHAASMR